MTMSIRRQGLPFAFLVSTLLVVLAGGCGDEPLSPVASTSTGAAPCGDQETACGDDCVDTATDAANCGACGTVCAPGEVCTGSACVFTCLDPLTDCGGACVNTQADLAHCGGCSAPCDAGEVCSNGGCALSCQASLTDCGGACVNTQTDLAHCGGCNAPCDAGEVCSNGGCALSCQASLTDCGGTCVNTQTDLTHCGGCNAPCDAGEVCSNGGCALSCQASLTECSDTCVDTQTDLAHCGGCNAPCDAGEVCSGGGCAVSCQAGLTDCNGACVNLLTDATNCGACGDPCAADEVCSNGECAGTTPVALRFLSVSDWHAQLDPLPVSGMNIGGAAALSTYFQNERAGNPNTITLTAGDAYGASPPLSSFFDEVPAIEAMNLMGFDADTFGNHNFDRGLVHLQSVIDLATFSYISSNLDNLGPNLTGVVEPYQLLDVGGVKIALIGITNPDFAQLVAPANLGTITVADPVTSAMAARDAAEAAGARVFIAIAHLGATGFDAGTDTYSGPLITMANGLSGFHIVFGDHTDFAVNTVINGARVVENRSKGLTYARVDLLVVPWTGVVVESSVSIISPVASAVTPDPAVEALLAPYQALLSAALDGDMGVATDVFVRGNNIERLQEVPIGDLLTDAMRLRYGVQLAITNGGGIRAPLPSSYLPANTALRRMSPGYAAGPPYDLVKGDAFATLPFGNVVVTRTVTGTQIWAMLENGISGLPAAAGRFPQISGFKFTYSASAPPGARVVTVSLEDDTPIPADATVYTLATNDFMNTGGDGYAVLADGTGTSRDVMADVLVDYILGLGTISPLTYGRIVALP